MTVTEVPDPKPEAPALDAARRVMKLAIDSDGTITRNVTVGERSWRRRIMVHAAVGPTAFGYPVIGLAGFLIAAFLGIGLAFGILRSGRL